MKKQALLFIGLLWVIAFGLYYPVFLSSYGYTDEVVQLWLYRKGSGFAMFADQGRFVTEALFRLLYPLLTRISQLTWMRAFSMLGWLFCLPLWYVSLRIITDREKLPSFMAFLTALYIITVPPFALFIGWSSCMEMFIADTCGFLSGFVLYASLTQSPAKPLVAIIAAVVLGIVSLSTYQNGFCCFIIPFVFHVAARRRLTRPLVVGVVVYFGIFVLYFLSFKVGMKLMHIGASGRASLSDDPGNKLQYFIDHPLTSAFHFTWIVHEDNPVGHIVSLILLGGLLVSQYFRERRFIWPLLTCVLFLLLYLPSLITKENFASNRTLFALELGVFVFCLDAFARWLRHPLFLGLIGLFLVGTAWYNIRYLFLHPLVKEYASSRAVLFQQYTPSIDTVYIIRPGVDLFTKTYGIRSSWDEFGIPGLYPAWVPEYFVRQVLFEKTGSQTLAARIVVRQWADSASWEQAGIKPGKQGLIIAPE